MKSKNQQDELITRKLSGSLTPEEQQLFDQKIKDDPDFKERVESYTKIWNASSEFNIPAGASGEERWRKLTAVLPDKTERSFAPYLKYAAVVGLLILAISAFFLMKLNLEKKTITTASGEIKKVVLPDHSVVTLNANSELSYVPSEFSGERRVKLFGEAYFEVQKSNLPFMVETNEAKVEVLGTTFNVRTFDQIVRVACSTGKVKVSLQDGKNQILTRGKGVKVSDHRLGEVFEVRADNIALWREGKLYFRETPLNEVLAEMERYFGVKIEADMSTEKRTFTGEFDHPKLKEMLQTICLSAGLDYKMVGEDTVKLR